MRRVDSASRLIAALPKAIYEAFAKPGAMERWLPPGNMKGEMLHFDFREGGSYRMRLTYIDPAQPQGKTSDHVDEVEVSLVRLEENRGIEQEIRFESEDPLSAPRTCRQGYGTRTTSKASGLRSNISQDSSTHHHKRKQDVRT
jgi:uncharacterized protein YndB with AHSA1/START domain